MFEELLIFEGTDGDIVVKSFETATTIRRDTKAEALRAYADEVTDNE